MLESIRGNSPLIDIVAGEKLRPGDVISARVVSREGAGRFRLIWNGRSLLAESQLNLKTGMTIRARVEGSSGALMLRLIGDAGTGAAVSQGAPSGGGSLMSLLSAAMLRAGLPLPGDAEAVRQAALLERTRGPRIRMARLYSELISKGADPTADFLEALEAVLSDSDSRGGGKHKRRQSGFYEPPAPEERSNEPLLDLLGAVDGRDGRWVFAKSRKALGDREVDLTWKIRDGRVPALALTVRDGERVLEFLLEGLDEIRMAVYSDDETQIPIEIWKTFRERLALMNIHVDDTISPMNESDGFTPGAGDVIRHLEMRR